MIWCPEASTVAAMPKMAPGVPGSIWSWPTKPPGTTGDTSISKLVIAPGAGGAAGGATMSPLPTTKSPFLSRAALIGALKGDPCAMTLAEAIEGPEKVGMGVGVAAVHCPFTITPSFGMLDTPAKAMTLFELVSMTYRVSLDGSYVSPEGPNMVPAVPPLQKPATISVN